MKEELLVSIYLIDLTLQFMTPMLADVHDKNPPVLVCLPVFALTATYNTGGTIDVCQNVSFIFLEICVITNSD